MGLKIVMVTPYPFKPGMVVGGIESVASSLVPALAAQDSVEKVTVLRFHHGEVPVHTRTDNEKLEIRYLRGQSRLGVLTRSILEVRQARRVVAELQPDIVHGQEIAWRGDVATQASPQSVVTVHGIIHHETKLSAETRLKDRLRLGLVEGMVKRVLTSAKVVISTSEYDSRLLVDMIKGQRVIIPNPTEPAFFELAPSGPTEPRLLFAGVLMPRKNMEGILRAFAQAQKQVPGAKLAVVGPHRDPNYAQSIRDLAQQLGLNQHVEFIGHVDNDQLRAEIKQARALVMFSREETAPTILSQAMAAGKPAVASNVGGIPEMIRANESGFLVESEDEKALAEGMVMLLKDQDGALRMGALAHEIAVQRSEPNTVARRTVEAYRMVPGIKG